MEGSRETALQFELANGGWMRILSVAPHTFRIRLNGSGHFPEPALVRYSILQRADLQCPFTVERYNDMFHVHAGQEELRIDTQNGQFSLGHANGQELICTTAVPTHQVPASVAFALHDGETLYGLGDGARGHLQKRGHKVDMWINPDSPYVPIPFVMSSRGWGLLLVTTLRHTFDLGCTEHNRMSIEIQDGEELDLYLFAGNGFGELLDRYTDIVGKPSLNPVWAYGLSYINSGYMHAWEVLNEALKFRQAGIPCDLIILNTGWSKLPDDGLANFEWHPERFPIIEYYKNRLPTFIDMLHKHGFKFGLKLACNYDLTGCEEQPESSGTTVEVTEQTAESVKSWYEHLQALTNDGVSAYIIQGDHQWEEHSDRQWANGMSDKELHNLYPVLLAKQTHNGFLKQTNLRPFVVNAMAGYSGIQKFASTISGGKHQKRELGMKAVLEFGLSGHAHATINMDLSTREGIHAGFLLTWAHVSHWSDFWNPLVLEDSLKELFRNYARLHYRLLPYLYSAAHTASRTGFPIVRAMPLMFPDDLNCQELNNQYMLGDFLLVAAFTERVYLPEGVWIDYWTGERYSGTQFIDYVIPEGAGGPLFIQAGAILPYWPDMDYIGQLKVECLELQLYPHQISEFVLYEDDGITFQYLEDQVAITRIRCQANERLTRIEIDRRAGYYNGMPRLRSYNLVIHNIGSKPVNIRLNEQPLAEQKHRTRTIVTVGWRYDRQEGTVHLHVEESTHRDSFDSLRIEVVHSKGNVRYSSMHIPTTQNKEFVLSGNEGSESVGSSGIALHTALNVGDHASLETALAAWWRNQLAMSASPKQWRIHLLNGAQLAIRHVERRGWLAEEFFDAEMDALFMVQNIQSPEQGYRLLQQLFQQSIRCALKPVMSVMHPTIREALAIVERDLAGKLTLHEAAAEIGIHPDHLSRLFKKEVGQSFSDYISGQRMEQAKALLEFGLKVREAAVLTGFHDTNYFSKIFRSYWGILPTSFHS